MKSPGYYLEVACRYYICAMLNIYGWVKICSQQFYEAGQLPDHATSQLADFDLAMLLFGHAYPYIFFIGLMQVTGGLLLLFNRTKLIGIAILLPLLLHMIVVDCCFGTATGALFSACLYLCLLLTVIYMNREQVKQAWRTLGVKKSGERIQRSEWLLTILLVTLMVIALVAAEQCIHRFFTQ